MRWLGARDAHGVEHLRHLMAGHPLVEIPLLAAEPSGLDELHAMGGLLRARLASASASGAG